MVARQFSPASSPSQNSTRLWCNRAVGKRLALSLQLDYEIPHPTEALTSQSPGDTKGFERFPGGRLFDTDFCGSVASNAAVRRQGSRPAGSAPVPGAFTPEKALKNGLFLPFSAGLDWRVGNPAAPQPLEQWQPEHRRILFPPRLRTSALKVPRTTDRRETRLTNYATPSSAQSPSCPARPHSREALTKLTQQLAPQSEPDYNSLTSTMTHLSPGS